MPSPTSRHFLAVRYSVCLSVCLWVSVRWICSCVANVVNTISWKVFNTFSPNFQHWCILGQERKLHVLGSKCRTCWKMHFSALLTRHLESYRLHFTKLSALMHFGTRTNASIFGVKKSKVKVTAWPRAQRPEAYRARRRVWSYNFQFYGILRFSSKTVSMNF